MHQFKKSVALTQIACILILSYHSSIFSSEEKTSIVSFSKTPAAERNTSIEEKFVPKTNVGIAFNTAIPHASKKFCIPSQPRHRRVHIYDIIHPKEYTLALWTDNFDTQEKSEEKVDFVLSHYYYWYVLRKNDGVNHETICSRLEQGTYPGATGEETLAFQALQANKLNKIVTYTQIKKLIRNKIF